MSRLMSVAFTEQAVRERRKTVTRRKGWKFLKPGDRLTLVRKAMGRKPGEPLVRIVDVEVVDVNREPLRHITAEDVALEGFPGMSREEFVRRYFIVAQDMGWNDWVTRIEWRYLDDPACYCESHDPEHHEGTCGHCGQDWDMECLPGCPVGGIVAARNLAEYGPEPEPFLTITITPVEDGEPE